MHEQSPGSPSDEGAADPFEVRRELDPPASEREPNTPASDRELNTPASEREPNTPASERELDSVAFRRDVERVLALIRPSVREDGGDIELVETIAPSLVRIRFLGACVGCPSSSVTLHHGIERMLRAKIDPAIRVEAVS